ncbi:hypothetical protein SLS60_009797 [Paraconiothyrium brasiliense]|uniref:Uncharacterized protein n=1 Tax=Paraconiothyrium brasiliense TaxID=300254 RepID=A0ABR3QSK8_9PLEO
MGCFRLRKKPPSIGPASYEAQLDQLFRSTQATFFNRIDPSLEQDGTASNNPLFKLANSTTFLEEDPRAILPTTSDDPNPSTHRYINTDRLRTLGPPPSVCELSPNFDELDHPQSDNAYSQHDDTAKEGRRYTTNISNPLPTKSASTEICLEGSSSTGSNAAPSTSHASAKRKRTYTDDCGDNTESINGRGIFSATERWARFWDRKSPRPGFKKRKIGTSEDSCAASLESISEGHLTQAILLWRFVGGSSPQIIYTRGCATPENGRIEASVTDVPGSDEADEEYSHKIEPHACKDCGSEAYETRDQRRCGQRKLCNIGTWSRKSGKRQGSTDSRSYSIREAVVGGISASFGFPGSSRDDPVELSSGSESDSDSSSESGEPDEADQVGQPNEADEAEASDQFEQPGALDEPHQFVHPEELAEPEELDRADTPDELDSSTRILPIGKCCFSLTDDALQDVLNAPARQDPVKITWLFGATLARFSRDGEYNGFKQALPAPQRTTAYAALKLWIQLHVHLKTFREATQYYGSDGAEWQKHKRTLMAIAGKEKWRLALEARRKLWAVAKESQLKGEWLENGQFAGALADFFMALTREKAGENLMARFLEYNKNLMAWFGHGTKSSGG